MPDLYRVCKLGKLINETMKTCTDCRDTLLYSTEFRRQLREVIEDPAAIAPARSYELSRTALLQERIERLLRQLEFELACYGKMLDVASAFGERLQQSLPPAH